MGSMNNKKGTLTWTSHLDHYYVVGFFFL